MSQSATQQQKTTAPTTMSKDGLARLTVREGLKKSYYNDQAGNCTYGIGTLVHKGECTADEKKSTVTDAMIQASLQTELQSHSKHIKEKVGDQVLSQEQFDALVSFTYNVGDSGAEKVLALVKEGKLNDAATKMQEYVYIHVLDKKTNKVVSKISSGLKTRRDEESAPLKTVTK